MQWNNMQKEKSSRVEISPRNNIVDMTPLTLVKDIFIILSWLLLKESGER